MEAGERIIEQAAAMFVEQGIKSVRMDDIANVCGVSKRTIYELFHDRTELVDKSMSYYYSYNFERSKDELKGAENVLEMFWRICKLSEGRRATNTRVFNELKRYYPAVFKRMIEQHYEQLHFHMAQAMKQGQREGLLLPELDVDFFSAMLSYYIYGVNSNEIGISNGMMSVQHDKFTYAITLFLRGLTTESGRRYIDEKLLNI